MVISSRDNSIHRGRFDGLSQRRSYHLASGRCPLSTERPVAHQRHPRKKPGRSRHDDRRILDSLIWLARTGSQWAGKFGPKSTAHARFQEWVQADVFERAWAKVLAEYDQ